MSALSPLHPNKQTLVAAAGMSVQCQQRRFALQKKVAPNGSILVVPDPRHHLSRSRIERGFDFLGYHFSPAGAGRGQEDNCKLHRESISAL